MTEPLSFDHLTSDLRATLENLPAHRQGKNTQYTLSAAGMSAFLVFFTQCPSFLAHQRLLETNRGKSNATTLFGMEKIPCDNQIRKLLDAIGPDELYPVFWSVYDRLKHGGYLSEYTGFSQNLLLSLDGLEYFSSKTLHCSNYLQKQSRDESTIYTSISPEWLRICFFLKVGQTLVAIELDGGQMVPLTTETPFAP